jgi:hypothetical protein
LNCCFVCGSVEACRHREELLVSTELPQNANSFSSAQEAERERKRLSLLKTQLDALWKSMNAPSYSQSVKRKLAGDEQVYSQAKPLKRRLKIDLSTEKARR